MLIDDPLVLWPIGVWCLMHVIHPDPEERISRFGVLLGDRYNFRRLLLHMTVHGNAEHLVNNIVVHAVTASTFRVPPGLEFVPRPLLGFGVMVVGAVAGVAAVAADQSKQRNDYVSTYGFGLRVLESVVGALHETVSNQRMLCGGSAAIAALGGYNAATQRSPLLMLMSTALLLPEMVAVVAPHRVSFFEGLGLSSGGPLIAHAAHVAGFASGFVIGLIVNSVADHASSLTTRPRPRRTYHQLGRV